MNKENNIKEKFKQALISTVKVISDDYKIDEKVKQNKSSKNYNFFELDNLNTRNDFIKLRAEADSEALKIKFSDKKIYLKNVPKKPSCKKLYDISEKIRYEILGSKMLKGISNNIKENYANQINLKRKDQLKSKEDVNIAEAFELYMLKNFLNIKLNKISTKILSFWEKELNESLNKHVKYLHQNIEEQELYNSKFSEILEEMGIFDSENNEEKNENSDDQNTEGEAPKALADESGKINPDVLQSIPVTISVEVGKTSLKIRDLLRLTQGSVVELERLAGEPLDLLVNNTVVAQGEVVLVNDRYGIRLTRVISAEERMKTL